MIRFMDKSIICNPRYQRYALDLAGKQGLAIQSSVREGGGNNGAMVSTALDGIPVIVVGVRCGTSTPITGSLPIMISRPPCSWLWRL